MKRLSLCMIIFCIISTGCSDDKESGATCGNGIIEGSEACDQTNFNGATCESLGLGTGQLICTNACEINDSGCQNGLQQPQCGNAIREGDEKCDSNDFGGATCETLGLGSGTLQCTSLCTLDTTGCEKSPKSGECGNGTREAKEQCDGSDFGTITCENLGLGAGNLVCTETCTIDTSKCEMSHQIPKCSNGIREGQEECDGKDFGDASCESLGKGTGNLKCTNTCTIDTTECVSVPPAGCGDGAKSDQEECDGQDFGDATCESLGEGTGNLRCTETCTIDTTECVAVPPAGCGDGAKNGEEECDDKDFGGATCETLGLGVGTLKCTETCAIDKSDCKKPVECGDGVREGKEECDGEDFGDATCKSIVPDKPFGRLGCTQECKIAAIFCGKSDLGLQAPIPDSESTDAQCSNGLNDFHTQNKDGSEAKFFDCANNQCNHSPQVQVCHATENSDAACSDGLDNQNGSGLHGYFKEKYNGLVDCADPSCFKNWRVTVCKEEAPRWELGADCEDGKDNDGDGLKDCEDPDCLHAGSSKCDLGTRKRILFDNAHHQLAGGVDWIIDITGRHPWPSMPKAESEWHGSLSSWALDLMKTGDYIVETLPADRTLTWKDDKNAQDLSQYQILVIAEPSSKITDNEAKAVFNFVQNGGSLLMVANHEGADRDANGYDSVRAFNEMIAAMPGAKSKEDNPFGFYVLPGAFSNNSKTKPAEGAEPTIIENRAGKIQSTGMYGAAGFQIVNAELAKAFLTEMNSSEIFALTAIVGKGRIVAIGDSAILGDGTNFLGLKLTAENGYVDTKLDNRILFLNAIDWLAGIHP